MTSKQLSTRKVEKTAPIKLSPLPAMLTRAKNFEQLDAFLESIPDAYFEFPFALEVPCETTPEVGLTLGFTVADHDDRSNVLQMLGSLEAKAAKSIWSSYAARLSQKNVPPRLLPSRLYAAVESFRTFRKKPAIDFAISTYRPVLSAKKQRATLSKCIDLFRSEHFPIPEQSVKDALILCGTANVEHIGVGTRASIPRLKLYAAGTLREILAGLAAAPKSKEPSPVTVNEALLRDLRDRMKDQQTSVPLDFVAGKLVRMGIELKFRERQVPVSKKNIRALLALPQVKQIPKGILRQIESLVAKEDVIVRWGRRFFTCGINHLKLSVDTAGKREWKAYFTFQKVA